MYNNNIFKKICHEQSGQEFDLGYIEEGTFIETLSLDGPKLLLTMMDPYSNICATDSRSKNLIRSP